ncbi:MAG: hypothetical protein KGJ77_06750 [Acidobacteriota bacterium]|nr:hypothetical protein [Acidobacteriota bacterium]
MMWGRSRPRGLRGARLLSAAGALAASLAACGAPSRATTASTVPARYAAGLLTETLVDPSRPTPANGTSPGHPGRTLAVTVFYPSRPTSSFRSVAPPDRRAAPYPLLVFAHGFPSSPDGYTRLLQAWASSGYVVAAPTFPLTNPNAPGGPDLADYVNQPGDLSFVVTQLEAQSRAPRGTLSGMVDPEAVGAAGHSLGGVTTLGLVADSCCQDARVKAAVVMAGDQLTYPNGHAEFPAIPLLFVHGSADPVVPYASGIVAFDAASAPKGLLTIRGGDHEAPVAGDAFDTVVRTTRAFFDLYLKHSGTSARLRADGNTGRTTLAYAPRPGERLVLPVPKATTGDLRASVVPATGLTDGQQVEVSWQGYSPGVTVNVLECSVPVTGAQDCDLHRSKVGIPDPSGTGSVGFEVHTGPIGTGTCDAAHPRCVVVVNEGGSSNPSDTVLTTVSFGN